MNHKSSRGWKLGLETADGFSSLGDCSLEALFGASNLESEPCYCLCSLLLENPPLLDVERPVTASVEDLSSLFLKSFVLNSNVDMVPFQLWVALILLLR